MKELTTKELIERAFDIKLAVRVKGNGSLCKPWGDEVTENYIFFPRLYLAKPCSITKALGSSKGFDVKIGFGPAKLKQIGQIFTYHEPKNDFGSYTIENILRQIPDEIKAQKVVAFEIVDSEHGLFFNPQTLKDAEIVKTRLYALEDGGEWENPDVTEQPVIYKGKQITRHNIDQMLEKLGENE